LKFININVEMGHLSKILKKSGESQNRGARENRSYREGKSKKPEKLCEGDTV